MEESVSKEKKETSNSYSQTDDLPQPSSSQDGDEHPSTSNISRPPVSSIARPAPISIAQPATGVDGPPTYNEVFRGISENDLTLGQTTENRSYGSNIPQQPEYSTGSLQPLPDSIAMPQPSDVAIQQGGANLSQQYVSDLEEQVFVLTCRVSQLEAQLHDSQRSLILTAYTEDSALDRCV